MATRTRYIQKALAGAEDLLIGAGTKSQTRNGTAYTISKVNATTIPYSGDAETSNFVSIKEAIDSLGVGVEITQVSHGFTVGTLVKSSGVAGAYAKAQSDSVANSEVLGVVTVVTDVDTFSLETSRDSIALTVAQWDAVCDESIPTGLTAGSLYYLSASTAGNITSSAPTALARLVLVATSTTKAIFVNQAGYTTSSVYGVAV